MSDGKTKGLTLGRGFVEQVELWYDFASMPD